MRTATAVAGMLASAVIGAMAGGWIISTRADQQTHQWPTDEEHSALSRIPAGDLAGAEVAHMSAALGNPLGEGPDVIADGKRLFATMNCAGCHGYGGPGGMGPNLTDSQWDFGGTPMEIYKSIYEGRAKGMPAWGHALPPETIWKLTAYVHSLGGGVPPSKAQDARHGDFVAEQRDTAGSPAGDAADAESRTEDHSRAGNAAADAEHDTK